MRVRRASQTADSPPGLLINRNFGLLWGGEAVSNLGDFVFDTTLILWIATRIAHGQSWAPLAVSGVLIATAVPSIAVGPIAGVFVDRWDRRRIMLWADALRACLIGLLLLASGHLSPGVQLGLIYAVVFLTTVCAQFFNPARFGIIQDIVPEEYQGRAAGLGQVTTNLAVIIGPPLAAPLLFGFGVQWALLINALSFVVSFIAISAIKVIRTEHHETASEPEPRSDFVRELTEGVRFFAGNRVLVTILIAAGVTTLGVGALDALDFFFAVHNLHAQPGLYGILSAASGAGSIVGAILAGAFVQRIGVARGTWLGLLGLGVFLLIYARMTSFAPALGVLFLASIPGALVNVAAVPLLLRVTPPALVGRVMAVLLPVMSLASMISIAVAGLLDSTVLRGFHASFLGITFGPVDTIFTGTAVLIMIAGLYAAINLREADAAGIAAAQ